MKRKRKSNDRTDEQRFRSTAAWQRCAHFVRDRDMNLCAACLHEAPPIYRGDPLEVHHIIPIKDAWDMRLDASNCITLCNDHHKLAEAGMIGRDALRAWVAEACMRSEKID